MSIFRVAVLLTLLSSHALSDITAPTCDSWWQWVWLIHFFPYPFLFPYPLSKSFNSINQNPCLVAAYLESTCNEGSQSSSSRTPASPSSPRAEFNLPAIEPGNSYSGPTTDDEKDLCKCNTVVYSLISACGACQGQRWNRYVPQRLPPISSPTWAFIFKLDWVCEELFKLLSYLIVSWLFWKVDSWS
jgi:hypothetical protein